jgi:tRNA G18 (ribose-2'-O)-methylase SpoU
MSETKTPQGILAVVKKTKRDLENILKEKGIFVVIDSLQDPVFRQYHKNSCGI